MPHKQNNELSITKWIKSNTYIFILLSLSLLVLAITDASRTQVNGLNVTLVKFSTGLYKGLNTSDGGNFRQLSNNNWVQTNHKGIVQFTYAETGRDQSSVYLHDISTNRTIVLDITHKNVTLNDEVLYSIDSTTPKHLVKVSNFDTITTSLKRFYFSNEFTTDGCSIPKDVKLSKLTVNIDSLVPDKYYEQFYPACVAHDYCYVSTWVPVGYYDERPLCDEVFLKDMKQICRSDPNLKGLNRAACLSYANTFYAAVYSNSRVLMIMAQVSNIG